MEARPESLEGNTRKIKTGCGTLYVTINELDGKPFEIFVSLGKAGGCAASQVETTGRFISMFLRSGGDLEVVKKQLTGLRCPNPSFDQGVQILSCSDGVARAITIYLDSKKGK
jgi:ribonucleoside-diphosphate reductase alpha chain